MFSCIRIGVENMAKRVKKKRSLRGKMLLSILYIALSSLVLVVVLPIINNVYEKDEKNQKNENKQVSFVSEPVDLIPSEHTLHESNISSDNKEDYFVSILLKMVGMVSYADNETWKFNNGGIVTEGIDSFGLVELAYYVANNEYLVDIGITKESIDDCMEIKVNELKIGDIGICSLPSGYIYGIYVGEYSNYPLFVYACSLPTDDYLEGCVYLSYDKNSCNELFSGMYPMDYDKYIRLPGMNYDENTAIKLSDYLAEGIIPSLEYNTYATAAYIVGEWLRTNDKSALVERINVEALEQNGLYLNKDNFENYIDSYNTNHGHDNYIYRMDGYTKSDDCIITTAELINVGKNDVMFERTGIYSTMTIYEDGTYIPAPIFSLSKYANLYGFEKIVPQDEENFYDNGVKIDRSNDYIVDLESLYRGIGD